MISNFEKQLIGFLLIGSFLNLSTAELPELDQSHDDDILALFDFEWGQIYYKDELLKACFIENLYSLDEQGLLIIPQYLPTIEPENSKNLSSLTKQFCGDFPIYSLSKLTESTVNEGNMESDSVQRNKRSSGQWYPGARYTNLGGNSQSQVQGQVSGQGFFSGQAQSQITGSSQTQVQLGGMGIVGSVSSSTGNAQAQIALGESTGSGQAGSGGVGPSKSQVQVNLGGNERGSMASAGVLADEGYSAVRHYGHEGSVQPGSLGGGATGLDHRQNPDGYSSHYEHQQPVGLNIGNLYPGQIYPSRYGVQGGGTDHRQLYPDFTNGQNNIYKTSPPFSQENANLPQLPDIRRGSNNFDLSSPDVSRFRSAHQDLGKGKISTNNGGVYSVGDSPRPKNNGHSIPTQQLSSARQYYQNGYPNSRSGHDNFGGNTAYAGSGLPHVLASSFGSGQAQAQSQMVHLGRGTTEFYQPQHGITGSLPYPKTVDQGNGGSNYANHYNTNGHVRPYLNGGNNQYGTNGQYSTYLNTPTPQIIPTTSRATFTEQPNLSHFNGRLDQQTQKHSDYLTSVPSQRQPSRTNGLTPKYSSIPVQQAYYPTTSEGEMYPSNGNRYNPITRNTYPSHQTSNNNDVSHGIYQNYGKTQGYSNGGANGKKCTVVTFTCTILIESNGRAKICRPNGTQPQPSQSRGNGGGPIDQGPLQICCC